MWEDGVSIDLNEMGLQVVDWTGFILSRMGLVAEGSNATPPFWIKEEGFFFFFLLAERTLISQDGLCFLKLIVQST